MELASQECCLHRYVAFVLVIITFVFTLYSVVLENIELRRRSLTLWCPRAIAVDSPPLLPPQLAATRVDTIIHDYRPSTSP